MQKPLHASRSSDVNEAASESIFETSIISACLPLLKVLSEAQQDGLTVRQLAILSLLVEEPRLHTVRGLATTLRIPKPAITRAINRLEREDLAERHPDLADRRSVWIAATPRGIRLLESIALAL